VSWSCQRSNVAKAGAPVSPQSSPPNPLALLRVRGLLLHLGSETVADLSLRMAASGEASILLAAILDISGSAPDTD
jgi:hypothetical protein